MVIFYIIWKKYNEIQLTKSKMDRNIRRMTNHPPSPDILDLIFIYLLNKIAQKSRFLKNSKIELIFPLVQCY